MERQTEPHGGLEDIMTREHKELFTPRALYRKEYREHRIFKSYTDTMFIRAFAPTPILNADLTWARLDTEGRYRCPYDYLAVKQWRESKAAG